MVRSLVCLVSLSLLALAVAADDERVGYYRQPAIHGDTVVFTSEGDLWTVGVDGGTARRLTTHLAQERHAAISPAGLWVAFSADYEGGAEAWVMPLAGGLPRRLTWDGEGAAVTGWTPGGEVLVSTFHDSTLPVARLKAIDPESGAQRTIPLDWAADATWIGERLYFTRFLVPRSYWKLYQGGRAQSIWSWAPGDDEATPVLVDHPGADRQPMAWTDETGVDRLVFVSDRSGALNLWSMTPDGGDLRQLTTHGEWDVRWPALDGDRVVYQLGGDLRLFDLAAGSDREIAIELASDFDQRRPRWVDEPMEYLTAAEISGDGSHVVLTARGQVFVVPVETGRVVAASGGRREGSDAARGDGARHRDAKFLPDGSVLSLSDASGEVELWKLDARGVAKPEQWTDDGEVVRHSTHPSPDGRWIAYVEHDNDLMVFNTETKEQRRVERSTFFGFDGIAWSPDSTWLAYGAPADNQLSRIRLYEVASGEVVDATTDRFSSTSPAFSPDGKWLYFVSERNLQSSVFSPWGPFAPQPHLDKTSRIFLVDLAGGERPPFDEPNELTRAEAQEKQGEKAEDGDENGENGAGVEVTVAVEGLAARLFELPIEPGRYTGLEVTDSHIFYLKRQPGNSARLAALKLEHEADETVVVDGVRSYWTSADDEKILVRKDDALYVGNADGSAWSDLGEFKLDLSGWSFLLDPVEEWRQMYVEAWRLHRDYFYDPTMHGVDWPAMRDKYAPLIERVSDRAELSDIFSELIAELSASHHYVWGGDAREGDDDEVMPASLGGVFERDEAAGGFRVAGRYDADPDLPEEQSPLAKAGVAVGEVVVSVNGLSALSVDDLGELLRNQAGKQVLLGIDGSGERREAIIEPIGAWAERDLRYDLWEYERRLRVDELSRDSIGYVHLRAMVRNDWTSFARHYFPVFERPGLIIDARNNNGGNIDSWILGFLLRKPWMWWTQRSGEPYHNMQYAYGGHLVVLCNEQTWSDGEAFCEGFKRLGLGPVIGTRTGGGEIWLTSSNVLVDRGIATAAEFGVFGPEGEWLIEGHGVEPDVEVDNLPHATFSGGDAQLEAAIDWLLQKIENEPIVTPEPPAWRGSSEP